MVQRQKDQCKIEPELILPFYRPSKCSNKFDNGSEVKLDQNKAKSIDVNDSRYNIKTTIKFVETISIEEKKIDLNIRPTQKDTSMSASKPKSEVKQDTDNRKLSHGSNRNLAHKHKSDNKHGYQKNKKWDEAKKHTIPYETVSSFYHCDENNVSAFKIRSGLSSTIFTKVFLVVIILCV
jgi:hypothetical protein